MLSPRILYGVPYMAMTESTTPPSDRFEITLRGLSPAEITARAQKACSCHFGECAYRIDQVDVKPCLVSLGGRVRLYECRFVATQ
jgi:hypothetical protein